METFIKAKKMVTDPGFLKKKGEYVSAIKYREIDRPLSDLIYQMNALPHVFTLQCCWGHFVDHDQENTVSRDDLSASQKCGKVLYRIAYIAFCIQNNASGIRLLKQLEQTTALNSELVQFGSATWFWEQRVNAYVLQVSPVRFKQFDRMVLGREEAESVVQVRNCFFDHIGKMVADELSR